MSSGRAVRLGAALALLAAMHPSGTALATLRSPASGIAPGPSPSAPAYYRPAILGGRAFPVARSNFLSLLEFGNDWHAPRLRFIGGRWRLVGAHEGIDITGEAGTPVLSMTPGVVENAGWTFYSGTRVGVRGDDGRYYLYAHLSVLGSAASPGARVAAGSPLGLLGNTGYGPPGHRDEFPPHLHFGIQEGSEWISPYPALSALYGATVSATTQSQRKLDALVAEGRQKEWEALAARVYMDFGL